MNFFNSYFSESQLGLLTLGFCFLVLSIFMQIRNRELFTVVCIVFTAIFIFSFSALLDPFLNLWDERFHALVAKNLMNHPFVPTLYDNPIVAMAYDRWDRCHFWLHKQPLFLWQIALSFKFFGVSEFTLRLPNIVLGTILIFISYRSGKLLVNQRVGYISALFMISSVYLLELIAGRQELEHNDLSFLVYVSLSIWSLIEYYYTKKKIWIYLIGLFSGMAILCKWLVGLLVYFGWFLLKIKQKKFRLAENKDFIISLVITIIIALPWQIYTLIEFPVEAINELKLNSFHFSKPIEGHGGDIWYHFNQINHIYGAAASLLIIPAFIVFHKTGNDKKIINSLVGMVIIAYIFFSLAATKMPSFTIIVFMIISIAFASLFDYIICYINDFVKFISIKRLIFSLSLIIVVLLKFDIESFQEKHTLWKESNQYSRMLIHNKELFTSLHLPEKSVLFNVKGRHYIEAMFYTGLPAYNFIPTNKQYRSIKEKGWRIILFNSTKNELPKYLSNDTSIIFINKEVLGYE